MKIHAIHTNHERYTEDVTIAYLAQCEFCGVWTKGTVRIHRNDITPYNEQGISCLACGKKSKSKGD